MPRVIFAVNLYLEELRAIAPDKVPSSVDLADAIELDPTNFSRMAQNKTVGINKKHLALLVKAFRDRGFSTTPGDLLRYYDDPT